MSTSSSPWSARALSRSSVVVAALAIGLAGVMAGMANRRPPAQPTAVMTVDLAIVLENLDERARLESDLQTDLADRQAQLDEIATRLDALRNTLQEGMLKPGTHEYKETYREYKEGENLIKTRRDFHNLIISLDKGAILSALYGKIRNAVSRIADRDGYDIVLINDSNFELPKEAPVNDMNRAIVSTSIVYAHPSVDITQQVIDLLNADFQAGNP